MESRYGRVIVVARAASVPSRPASPRKDRSKIDFVFTVCDNAAGEACPICAGQPMTAHWGIEDPAAVAGPEFKQRAAFEDAVRFMRNRIAAFTSLPLEAIDTMALGSKLRGIGAMDGSTRAARGAV